MRPFSFLPVLLIASAALGDELPAALRQAPAARARVTTRTSFTLAGETTPVTVKEDEVPVASEGKQLRVVVHVANARLLVDAPADQFALVTLAGAKIESGDLSFAADEGTEVEVTGTTARVNNIELSIPVEGTLRGPTGRVYHTPEERPDLKANAFFTGGELAGAPGGSSVLTLPGREAHVLRRQRDAVLVMMDLVHGRITAWASASAVESLGVVGGAEGGLGLSGMGTGGGGRGSRVLPVGAPLRRSAKGPIVGVLDAPEFDFTLGTDGLAHLSEGGIDLVTDAKPVNILQGFGRR